MAKHLLANGYFPSAPLRPKVAFNMKMLEFIRGLYLRSSPNRSAWAATLESYLRDRGDIVTGVETTRRKLAKACRFYDLLLDHVEAYVHRQVSLLLSVQETGDDDEWLEDNSLTRMEYLAMCCPLCFGAVAEADELTPADVIVCLDACFTQKRRKSARGSGRRDPPFRHPLSAFLTEEELLTAKRIVETARPSRPSTAPAPPADPVEQEMKVSRSVLDACSDSFQAADEKRSKASTGFFADTGLMALLCRHNRVLWLANITTPGERQHYAIALILKLFEFIPQHWSIGVLYDIGCQLHRSCVKWDFIPQFIDRIIWGISVFHAYGHQWPCQLIYHPHKCVGFGLSDEEGCERFWSSIQGLIPSLRVSGYHQRLLVLDHQIWYLRDHGLLLLGSWLVRKWTTCMEKKEMAKAVLEESEYSMEQLGGFWADQVHIQTAPLVSATAGLAKAALQEIVKLTTYRKSVSREITFLDRLVKAGGMDADEAGDRREELLQTLEDNALQIRRKRATLGVSETANLKRLETNQYLKLRMQARAKRDRIQSKYRERRFEVERTMNRVYSHLSASERRLEDRIQSAMSKHGSSMNKMVMEYNKLCDDIQELIRKCAAPRHAVAPKRLNSATIYSLDVDDPIWSDRGLDEEDSEPPIWLRDDEACEGIKALLMWRRCEEEECYLTREVVFLQLWYNEEWSHLKNAIPHATGGLLFYLKLKQEQFLYLGSQWRVVLEDSGLSAHIGDWGPSNGEFSSVLLRTSGSTQAESGASDSSSEIAFSSDRDDILSAIEDMYLSDSDPTFLDLDSSDSDNGPPKKRKRT